MIAAPIEILELQGKIAIFLSQSLQHLATCPDHVWPNAIPAHGCNAIRLHVQNVLSSAPEAQIQPARDPGGFNHIKICLAGRIGLARAGSKPGFRLYAPKAQQAAQFRKRRGVIINAQIDIGEILSRGQHQGSRLASALVPARRFTGIKRSDQTFRQRKACIGAEAIKTRLHHTTTRQHIARDAETITTDMPAPFNAIIAGPGGVAAMAIHSVDLAQALAFITHQRCFNGLGGRQAAFQTLQYGGA
jgi:hypothetical protein